MTYLEFFASVVSSLAWPVALGVSVWIFVPHLPTLLTRLKNIGPKGAEFYQPTAMLDTAAEATSVELSETDFEPLTDEVALKIESRNQSELDKFAEERRIPILLRALTAQELYKLFALAYADIFGGQIHVLDTLNSRQISLDEANELFSQHKKNDPVIEDWNLEKYMNYLIVWKFVEKSDENFRITTTGQNFLNFILTNRLSKERLH